MDNHTFCPPKKNTTYVIDSRVDDPSNNSFDV